MPPRRLLIAGNAKMNLDRRAVTGLLETLKRELAIAPPRADVLYCPPASLLAPAALILSGSTILLGAQNMHWEEAGAFTGEISATMIREWGGTHVLLGHSERRALFGETDDSVRRKAGRALAAGLVPVVCVGETEAERRSGATEIVLSRQAAGSLGGLGVRGPRDLVVAYEPVWAIGTGNTATAAQAQEAHRYLRGRIAEVLGGEIARGVRILYGGSVKPENAEELCACPDIDGVLVGGASLRAESFLGIISAGGRAAS
jgi:triosephosphate isomerase